MAIPNSPTWAEQDAPPMPYLNYGVVKPQPLLGIAVQSCKIGPLIIGDSRGNIAERFWLVTYESPNVFIRGSASGYWEQKEILFQDLDMILQLDLTFDQLGRPIVIYLTNDDDIKLFWFDPVLVEQTTTLLSTGTSVASGFDLKTNTGDQNSDAMVSYVRDDRLYWRLQRDRWAVEYDPNISHQDLKVLSMGMTDQNRFQIQYDFAIA